MKSKVKLHTDGIINENGAKLGAGILIDTAKRNPDVSLDDLVRVALQRIARGEFDDEKVEELLSDGDLYTGTESEDDFSSAYNEPDEWPTD